MDFKMINLPLIQSSTRTAAEFQADMFFNDIPAYLHRNLSPNYIQYVHFISCYKYLVFFALFSGSSALSYNCIQTSCSCRCCKLMMIRTTQLAYNCNSWDRLIVPTLSTLSCRVATDHFFRTACWKRETQWGKMKCVSKKGLLQN